MIFLTQAGVSQEIGSLQKEQDEVLSVQKEVL